MLINVPLHDFFTATWQTIYMVFIASFLSVVIGGLLGVVLFLTKPRGLKPNPGIYQVLGFVVNIGRSIPYIILMIAVIPITRMIVGTTIGTNAAIVPLALAAIPVYARIAESAFNEVAAGALDAALSLGASAKQIIRKVVIPEGLPSLIKGGTLTVIALIGYSAMAGAVGGGGLGQLAIDYGYQQFDVAVMLITVVVLVVIVQIVQWGGDWFAKHRSLKALGFGSLVLWVVCILSQLSFGVATTTSDTLTVGIMSGTQQQIMAVAQRVAYKRYGLHLKLVAFNDYNMPNEALVSGDIDANIFQHVPFLDSQIKAHGYKIVPIARTFMYPMGVFSSKIHTLSQLQNGAQVAIPNDPSNEGRALRLFAKNGLITLKPGVGILGDVNDILSNPHHLQFVLMNAAQVPRALKDVTLAAINNNYLKPAGLRLSQALFHEGANAPYGNIIAVRQGDHNPLFKELINVMHSQPVVQAVEKAYPHGAAIPAWKK